MSDANDGVAPPFSPVRQSADASADLTLDTMQRKVGIGLAFALTCLGLVGVMSYLIVVRLQEQAAWVEHSHDVLSRLELVLAAITDCETAERGYVISGDESYLEPYRQSSALIGPQVTRLRRLTADNPAQQARVEAVALLVAQRLSELGTVIQLRNRQGFGAAQSELLTGKGKRFHDQIRGVIAQTNAAEAALLKEREESTNRSVAYTKAGIIGGGLLAFGIVGFGFRAVRRDFAGRKRAERALREAKDQLELRVEQRTAQLEKAGESNARLASIIESSDDAIAQQDLAGIITSWNPAPRGCSAMQRAEAVGRR